MTEDFLVYDRSGHAAGMVEHPAFVCSREGHIPVLTFGGASAPIEGYVCSCKRCGRMVEFPVLAPLVEEPGT